MPSKTGIAFQYGAARLRKVSTAGSQVESVHFLDSASHRPFAVNVSVDSDIHCQKLAARGLIQTPGGKTVCYVWDSARRGVDIRYTHDGILYLFSYLDAKKVQRNDAQSDLGRWALAIIDSYI